MVSDLATVSNFFIITLIDIVMFILLLPIRFSCNHWSLLACLSAEYHHPSAATVSVALDYPPIVMNCDSSCDSLHDVVDFLAS